MSYTVLLSIIVYQHHYNLYIIIENNYEIYKNKLYSFLPIVFVTFLTP